MSITEATVPAEAAPKAKRAKPQKEQSPEDLRRSIEAAKTLRREIAHLLGAGSVEQVSAENETVLQDTFDGETTLDVALREALIAEDDDRIMVDGIKKREGELAERRQRLERRMEARRGLMEQAMAIAGWSKHTFDIATVSLGKARPRIEVVDESDIPSQFFKRPDPPEPVLDKSGLLDALVERHRKVQEAIASIDDPAALRLALARIDTEHPAIPGCRLETGGVQISIRRK